MQEGQTIAKHIAKITDLRDQLVGVDEEIEDKKLVTITLNSLAPSFGTFVTSLSIMLRAAPISFDELVGLLLQEEERTSNFAHSSRKGEQALAMHGKGKFQSKGGYFQKKKTAMDFSPKVRQMQVLRQVPHLRRRVNVTIAKSLVITLQSVRRGLLMRRRGELQTVILWHLLKIQMPLLMHIMPRMTRILPLVLWIMRSLTQGGNAAAIAMHMIMHMPMLLLSQCHRHLMYLWLPLTLGIWTVVHLGT